MMAICLPSELPSFHSCTLTYLCAIEIFNSRNMNEELNLRTDFTRQYESLTRMIRQVQESQEELKESVAELKIMRDKLVRNITLDNLTLEIILEVSYSTLYRWRNAAPPNNLPYYMRENGNIYYDFDEVLAALRRGHVNIRGFNRMKAIENMKEYRENILSSKGTGAWLVSDK